MSYMKAAYTDIIDSPITLDAVGGIERTGFIPLPDNTPTPFDEDEFTPQSIEAVMSSIYGQDEAKKVASMIVYNLLEYDMPTTTLFIGETGTSKTEIWRQLKKEYTSPNGDSLIEIFDASNMSASGWKGCLHLDDILKSLKLLPHHSWNDKKIVVLDEFDKCWFNKNNDVDYFALLSSQLLKFFEHEGMSFPGCVPPENISVVCLGAFSSIYKDRRSKKGSIGFSCEIEGKKEDITIRDELLQFNMSAEMIGRFNAIVELNPPSLSAYLPIAIQEKRKLEKDFHKQIVISDDMLVQIAEEALDANLGARHIKNRLFNLCQDAIYNDCFCSTIQIEDYPVAEM